MKEPAAPPGPIVFSRKLKPRDRPTVGDRWRVRVSQYPMQLPEPEWQPPETWLFVATEVQRTEDGPRLLVTATREGAVKPSIFLQLDPQTGAILQADIILPAAGGERVFTERVSPGEPFVSQMSPVPIALAVPEARRSVPSAVEEDGKRSAPPAELPEGKAEEAGGEGEVSARSSRTADGSSAPGPPAFGFGQRFSHRTEPLDAGAGQAMIQRGLRPLNLPLSANLEAFGVPRFLTVIEAPGLRVEQVWDESTPWPLYSQTDTSRSWLVVYTKGKST
jgi:hypothetical protein